MLATAPLNRFRLRELEDTLVELNLALPRVLQRYLVATLDDDNATLEALSPHICSLICCQANHGEHGAQPRTADLAVRTHGAGAPRAAAASRL